MIIEDRKVLLVLVHGVNSRQSETSRNGDFFEALAKRALCAFAVSQFGAPPARSCNFEFAVFPIRIDPRGMKPRMIELLLVHWMDFTKKNQH